MNHGCAFARERGSLDAATFFAPVDRERERERERLSSSLLEVSLRRLSGNNRRRYNFDSRAGKWAMRMSLLMFGPYFPRRLP